MPLHRLHPQPQPNETILTVGLLTRWIKQVLEGQFTRLWVRGEISNFKRQESGHCYFSLKDRDSQLPAVMFRGDNARCLTDLRDGKQVLVLGMLSVYEPRGYYQLIVREVLDEGMGRLQARFEELKRKLAAEGLFDPARKKPLPSLPRRIGFVTSPTGAAVQDFISVLMRRGWQGYLLILPTRVQGAEAAAEIVRRIRQAEELGNLDLLVVGRGGGSMEDLWPFNEEIVARAVASCRIPLISAVGHEIDFTLCDYASDRRVETPTAAAELITSSYLAFIERLRRARQEFTKLTVRRLEDMYQQLDLLREKLLRYSPARELARYRQQVHYLHHRLEAQTAKILETRRTSLQLLKTRWRLVAPDVVLQQRRAHLKQLQQRLFNLGPEAVLRRGYVIVRAGTAIIERASELPSGHPIELEFADGKRSAFTEMGGNSGSP